MSKRAPVVLFVVSALAVSASAQIRRGSEFQVNTHTTGDQRHVAIARRADGDFVVVWTHPAGFPTGDDVFARVYDVSGTPFAPEFRVNEWTEGAQRYPAAAATANGEFLVVWSGEGLDDLPGVFGRVINPYGYAVGNEFRINAYVTGVQTDPAVAADADGNVTVVWSGNGPGDFDGVFGRRLQPHGLPLTSPFAVNTHIAGAQHRPAVASKPDGDFVVLWQGTGAGNGEGVFARRFTADGQPIFDPFGINSYQLNDQGRPAVASDGLGSMFMAWNSFGQDGDQYGVYARRILPDGGSAEGEFRVNSYTRWGQGSPSIAWDPSGNFVVVWQSDQQDGSGTGIFGQRYDASFTPVGTEFRVNSYTTQSQADPVVASDPNGNWVVAWNSHFGQDGSGSGVFAQLFSPDRIFDNGFQAGGLSAWSLSNTDGGDLAVAAAAGLRGTSLGLRGIVDDTAGLWVQDDAPLDENRYRARFYFDPNGFDPGEAQNHRRTRIFIAFEESPTRRLAAIVLRRIDGAYGLMGRARLDDNSQYDTGFFPISDDAHFVELDWKRASGPDADDGSFELWIDGVSVHAATTLDNSISAVDFVRMGAISVKTGASGTLYWDEFRSRRASYIGQF